MKRNARIDHFSLLVLATFAAWQWPVLGADTAAAVFNGNELSAWRQPTGQWTAAKAVALDSADARKLTITPGTGVLVNGSAGKTSDLVSEGEFGDIEAHIEFCISKQSNSGGYLTDVELTGPTRGALSETEKPSGPIRLQGDHGPVAFRNITVKRVELP